MTVPSSIANELCCCQRVHSLASTSTGGVEDEVGGQNDSVSDSKKSHRAITCSDFSDKIRSEQINIYVVHFLLCRLSALLLR